MLKSTDFGYLSIVAKAMRKAREVETALTSRLAGWETSPLPVHPGQYSSDCHDDSKCNDANHGNESH